MKNKVASFGLSSGICTSLGFTPHIINLVVLLFVGKTPPVVSLIMFAIIGKILGEWLFWKYSFSQLNSDKKLKNWKSILNFKNPNLNISLSNIFSDLFVDAFLIYIAFKADIPPIWIFLSLLSCQAISSPLHGLLSDYIGSKKMLIVASISGLAIVGFASTIFYDEKISEYSNQILLLLCLKGLLSNPIVTARIIIAKTIQTEWLIPKKS